MKLPTDWRTMLIAVVAAAVTAMAETVVAQPTDISGVVSFEGGAIIPEGHIEIYLNDPAKQDRARRRTAETRVKSDGGSKTIHYFLSLPAGSARSSTLQIVARLEREDGWLIARGSAQVDAGVPFDITLNTAMY